MELRGLVVKALHGQGTKSEHEAVLLDTGAGTYRLRRAGGNPFADPELDRLVGQQIVCTGTVHQGTVIMSDWRPAGG
jgi:hypothetical protein